MNISIFGLGYVGAVTAACLAKGNHAVIGVDLKEEKVNAMNHGKAPFYEKDLDELISQAVQKNRLKATNDVKKAVEKSAISLICVGTPSNPDGSLNLDYVKNVCKDIGTALKYKDEFHVVVIRSTVLLYTTWWFPPVHWLYAASIHPLSLEHFDSRLVLPSQILDHLRVMFSTGQPMRNLHLGNSPQKGFSYRQIQLF